LKLPEYNDQQNFNQLYKIQFYYIFAKTKLENRKNLMKLTINYN